MAHDLGDPVVLAFEARDADGQFVTVAGVALTIGLPDGTSITPVLADPVGVGEYRHVHTATMPGLHSYRWAGPGVDGRSDVFDVRAAMPRYLVSLVDAKRKLNFSDATDDDEELRTFVEAVTDVVETWRHEVIARRTVQERLTVTGGTVRLTEGPVLSVATVTSLDGSRTWNVADLDFDGTSLTALSGPALTGTLRVVYAAGYRELPASYSLAAHMILRHLWQTQRRSSRRGGGYGSTDGGGGGGEVEMVAGWAVPRAALQLLNPPAPLVA